MIPTSDDRPAADPLHTIRRADPAAAAEDIPHPEEARQHTEIRSRHPFRSLSQHCSVRWTVFLRTPFAVRPMRQNDCSAAVPPPISPNVLPPCCPRFAARSTVRRAFNPIYTAACRRLRLCSHKTIHWKSPNHNRFGLALCGLFRKVFRLDQRAQSVIEGQRIFLHAIGFV